MRTRKILRKGTNYYRTTNSDCTLPLHEQRVCIRGDNCIEYSWQLSDWTSCLVNGGFEQCGVGHKERYSWCRDQQGRPMENFHCEKVSYSIIYISREVSYCIIYLSSLSSVGWDTRRGTPGAEISRDDPWRTSTVKR